MPIQIYVGFPECHLRSTIWEYEISYENEHGNTGIELKHHDMGVVENITEYQLYLKALHEALLFLNSHIETKHKLDTNKITVHIPCEPCIEWLTGDSERMLSPKDRERVTRGYLQFVREIRKEGWIWNITYTTEDVS